MSSPCSTTAPESGIRIELDSLNVQVSPKSLQFGLGTHQAPVNTLMTQELVVKSTQSRDVWVLVAPVNNPKNLYKFRVKASPSEPFIVRAGTEENVIINMKVLCTTTLKMELSIKTWADQETQFKEAVLSFSTESELSTRLDPDELKQSEHIGDGTFDAVYRGEYRGRSVAVKVRKTHDDVNCMMGKNFKNEIRMMENLRHPAIVGFIGAVIIPDKYLTIVDLCQYGNIIDAMKNHPDSFKDTLRIKCLLDISSAMHYLHESGFVHRDLKPPKILIASLEPYSDVCAKLTGFEIARNLNRSQSEMMITMTGTPLFMAPEIMNCQPYDKSVDVYSFALVMYFVITGKMPFLDDPSSDSLVTLATAVQSGKRPEIPASCPLAISELMKKSWSGKPSERPSFEVIHNTIKEVFQHMTIAKKGDGDGKHMENTDSAMS